jgi:hypothetical protein
MIKRLQERQKALKNGADWAEFCANPVKDFFMPSGRTADEDFEIRATVDAFVARFKREEIPVFVA